MLLVLCLFVAALTVNPVSSNAAVARATKTVTAVVQQATTACACEDTNTRNGGGARREGHHDPVPEKSGWEKFLEILFSPLIRWF